MSSWVGLFGAPKNPVQSLAVQAGAVARPRRRQNQFGVLVGHLIYRFFHNELLASDDETKRVMLMGYTVALPGLLVALFLYPAYHSFPPNPYPRPYWPQACDHYFYVMYSFVIMGAVTVYEWDLLFPDLLDVFVLSPLPITRERLFFARVLALAIFLSLMLFGTSILGMIFLPLVAEQHHFFRHIFGHAIAVLMSGTFAAGTFLALQGILLNLVGENVFRRITPVLQGGSMMVLLAILLLEPTLTQSLPALINSGIPAVRWFPPFWFLGIYERIMVGPAALPVFHSLARTGCFALLIVIALTLLTYPLAYRRRVRQLIEGARAASSGEKFSVPLDEALHATVLRRPQQRAVFHFVSQTILRYQRQRVMVALLGGLSFALVLAEMVVLRVTPAGIRPALLAGGIRAAIPIMVFCTVAGLRSVLSAAVDRRGTWLFGTILGRPREVALSGARLWVTTWAMTISVIAVVVLHRLSPASMQSSRVLAGQLIVAVGLSLVLSDLFLFHVRTLPFTHLHKSAITDMPLAIVRYFILFPVMVMIVVGNEPWIEASGKHLFQTALVFATAHVLLQGAQEQSVRRSAIDTAPDEADEFPQSLGLRDS
jgi:hypothetical protein